MTQYPDNSHDIELPTGKMNITWPSDHLAT